MVVVMLPMLVDSKNGYDKFCPESPQDKHGHYFLVEQSGLGVCRYCTLRVKFYNWQGTGFSGDALLVEDVILVSSKLVESTLPVLEQAG